MTKFLVSYLFKTTDSDLHEAFKKHAENNNFCEYIYATNASGKGKYCKLPHTTLWCERINIDTVQSEFLKLAEEILSLAEKKHRISPASAATIRLNGGLIENLSISYLLAPAGITKIMLVKEGTFKGEVSGSVSLANCLNYQKANS